MTAPTYYLGIDPGVTGALAIICPGDWWRAEVHDMPTVRRGGKTTVDAHALAHLIHRLVHGRDVVAAVELVGSRPRQAGAFAFGASTGIVHGILAAYDVSTVQVPPTVWKAAFGLTLKQGETQSQVKTRARETAARLIPSLAASLTRVRDDGRAEAALIALYLASHPR